MVVLGDAGEGNQAQNDVAEAIYEHCEARADALGSGCDLALYLGDNIYDDGVPTVDDPRFDTHFEAPYARLAFPFYVVLGNHDYGVRPLDSDHAVPELSYADTSERWTMPARAYHLTAGPAELFALDSHALLMEPLWGNTGQAAWLEDALARVPDDRWRVVFAHHPIQSDGQHGDAGAYEGVPWLPVVRGSGVAETFARSCGALDFWLAGHDHNLQWQPPTCGTELVVSGAGAKTTALARRDGDRALFSADHTPGFVWLELSQDGFVGEVVDRHGAVLFRREGGRPHR